MRNLIAMLAFAGLLGLGAATPELHAQIRGGPMPEFTTASPNLWVNSKPLKKADLTGKVLMLEIWTSI